MTLDLLLINPGAAHGITGGHAIYGDLGATLIAKEPPLWCRLIAGYVRDRGFSVKIIDAEAEEFSPGATAMLVGEYMRIDPPRLICICVFGHQPSASTQQMDGAGRTAEAIKERGITTQIIMVGGHVAALPERTLREEAIDYACNGEGPTTITFLLHYLRNKELPEEVRIPELGDIPGLVWRHCSLIDPHQIVNNKPAPLIPINELHGDVWDLLPMHLYRAHNWQCFGDLSKRQPYASIYTSLGCPYRCSFCCIQSPFSPEINGNRYRMCDPGDVVREIVKLWTLYGVKTYKIVDEMFVLNRKHYTAICNALIAQKESGVLPPDLNVWAYARVDTVQPDTLAMFKEAGIQWLALGIESGSKHVRDGAEKNLRTEDIAGVVAAIKAAGINVIGNYIFGLPDDTDESMRDTLNLALSLNTEFANFYSAMAYPGSSLYTEAVKNGSTLPASWRGYSQHNSDCRPLDTEHISAKEVLQFRDFAFERYFKDAGYLKFIEEKFGAETLQHVKDMTKYTLPRKLLTGEIQ